MRRAHDEARVLAPPRAPSPLVNRSGADQLPRDPPATNARGWPAQMREDRPAMDPYRGDHEDSESDDFDHPTWGLATASACRRHRPRGPNLLQIDEHRFLN